MNLVEAAGLTVGYRKTNVFADLSLAVGPGESVALTGPSGSGKSSLLYALAGMLQPKAGSVWLAGHRVTKVSGADSARIRADVVGFVFQDALLDPARTVLDSVTKVALYRGQSRTALEDRGRELLVAMGIGRRLIRSRPGQMSGGQAQRVGVARALVGDPLVVFADEPTGNLDHTTAELVMDALLGYVHRRGACLLIATHDLIVRDRCDRVITL